LIQVKEKKPSKTFEELRPELQKRLEQEASRNLLNELKANTKIVIDPAFGDADNALVGLK